MTMVKQNIDTRTIGGAVIEISKDEYGVNMLKINGTIVGLTTIGEIKFEFSENQIAIISQDSLTKKPRINGWLDMKSLAMAYGGK